MLMRTPSAPAASIASNTCGSREAGPMVASIFAFLMCRGRACPCPFFLICRAGLVPAHSFSNAGQGPALPLQSNQKRNYGRDSARVLIKFSCKHFSQELLFAAHANECSD